MRALAPLLVVLWSLAFAAPTWTMLRWGLDHDRIAREECVQKDMPDELRTCYGRCQLIRALHQLREKEQQGPPAAPLVKWEPTATVEHELPVRWRPSRCARTTGMTGPTDLLAGFPTALEGVPRA